MADKDGGPAFPCKESDGVYITRFPGMTLRDCFAAQALSGCDSSYYAYETDLARYCYRVADAMIKARSAKAEEGK